MSHYKNLRGKMKFDDAFKIVNQMDLSDTHRAAVYDYFVHGIAVEKLKANNSSILPALHKFNDIYLNNENQNDYMQRFLYTNEFTKARLDHEITG